MAGDVAFKNLLDQALDAVDPFLAAACHPYADRRDRHTLESILFATSRLKRQFAGAMYTPSSVLGSLAQSSDQRIRLRVAKHPAATPATMAMLARTLTTDDLCVRVAGHRNTPPGVLKNLYNKHPHSPAIRRALCYNPHTPGALLKQLAVGAAPVELKGMVRNPQADHTLLRQCWQQHDEYLQAEVAVHPNCPPELLDSAERAPQALVRRKLAQNPVLPDPMLLRLLDDSQAQVRAAAVRNLSTPLLAELDADSGDPSRQVRRDQARHQELPLSWINHLSQDTDSWVRRLVARNPGVTGEALCKLAKDTVTEVRRGAARNPACPGRLLKRLARDPQPWVRAGVAMRHDIGKPLIIALSRNDDIDVLSALGKNPGTPQKILERISRHGDRDVRRAVILNGGAPRPVLCGLLQDPYPLNRVLLAGHRGLDNADLQGFLHDPEPTVRFAGAQALAARLHRTS